MSLYEPRCRVCGAPLDRAAIFNKDPRKSETCSDKCADIYFNDEDKQEGEAMTDEDKKLITDGRKRNERHR